jgi:hypothetical protein
MNTNLPIDLDIPEFVPNRRREENLKKGSWRQYRRTASLSSSSSEASCSNSSEDETEFVFAKKPTGGSEDMETTLSGLSELDLKEKHVKFASESQKQVHSLIFPCIFK